MTAAERALLLTTARILRATIRDMLPTANGEADIADLNEALRQFDPIMADPINEEQQSLAPDNPDAIPVYRGEVKR